MNAMASRIERATEIFCEVMGVEASSVSDATAYSTFSQWDSLKHMEMVARIEEAFGIDLDIEDVIAMETLGRVKEVVARYVAARR